jgi:hypothetical protein
MGSVNLIVNTGLVQITLDVLGHEQLRRFDRCVRISISPMVPRMWGIKARADAREVLSPQMQVRRG